MMNEPFFRCAREVAVNGKIYAFHSSFCEVSSTTNPQKIWNRYAGCLIIEGQGRFEDHEGKVHELCPGTFIHHHPHLYHHIERKPVPWREYVLGCDKDFYAGVQQMGLVLPQHCVFQIKNIPALVQAFNALRGSLEHPQACYQNLMMEVLRLFSLISQEATRTITQREDPLLRAKSTLENDFAVKVNLEELALGLSMSYPHFRAIFKQQFLMSPGAYRKECRLRQARLLLSISRISIAELAIQMGYQDQFAFSKEFKRRFGESPKRYNLNNAAI